MYEIIVETQNNGNVPMWLVGKKAKMSSDLKFSTRDDIRCTIILHRLDGNSRIAIESNDGQETALWSKTVTLILLQ